MKTLWISIILLLSLVSVSCGLSQSPLSTSYPVPPTQGAASQMTPSLPAPSPSSLDDSIEKAKQDLAQRLSLPVSDVSLLEAKQVTWPDGSLGCPQPGMLYAQVITPGFLIKLKYEEQTFEYHAGRDGSFTYCENPLPPVQGMPDNT